MTSEQLDRLANLTGESPRTLRRLGFQIENCDRVRRRSRARFLDWDRVDQRRNVSLFPSPASNAGAT